MVSLKSSVFLFVFAKTLGKLGQMEVRRYCEVERSMGRQDCEVEMSMESQRFLVNVLCFGIKEEIRFLVKEKREQVL